MWCGFCVSILTLSYVIIPTINAMTKIDMDNIKEAFELGYTVTNPSNNESMVISQEKKLTQHLLHRLSVSGREGRPVVNMSEPTSVFFGLGLIQMDLDERDKVLTTSMWSKIRWRDAYLTWDPGEYGGVTVVRLEVTQVWTPDIMLFNTADPKNARRNAQVVVTYSGVMQWVPHQIYKSSCSIDVANFPFDRQTCNLWFGSWTHTLKDIDLNFTFPAGIDLSTFQSDYKDSCEWEIVLHEAERKLLPENDTDPVAVLAFTLHLERKLVFSSYILTLPCVFLASLTMVVFWLPADRPDRTGLAMSLFSSFLVLLLILVEAAPPTASSVPILGVYYCFNMVIIMCSIFLSSLIINIYRAGEISKPVPKWLRVIVLSFLGKLLCRNSIRKYKRQGNEQYIKVSTYHSTNQNNGMPGRKTKLSPTFEYATMSMEMKVEESDLTKSNKYLDDDSSKMYVIERQWQRLDKMLKDLLGALDCIADRNAQRDGLSATQRRIISEWREVAVVLDRFFCLVYLVLIIISLVFLFPRPPGFF